jgi:peptide chain release factor
MLRYLSFNGLVCKPHFRKTPPLILSLRSIVFASSAVRYAKPLPPLPQIKEADITETFLKGSGPGGQKINKTSSAVQIQHHPTGIVVKCQDTRSRAINRKIAMRRLQERIEELEKGDQARTIVKRMAVSKKKASADKKKRRKYRALEDSKKLALQDQDSLVHINKTAEANVDEMKEDLDLSRSGVTLEGQTEDLK